MTFTRFAVPASAAVAGTSVLLLLYAALTDVPSPVLMFLVLVALSTGTLAVALRRRGAGKGQVTSFFVVSQLFCWASLAWAYVALLR